MTNLDNIFSALPAATLVVTDLGHAYGKAKYSGRCPVTGTAIYQGESIRRIAVQTRNGDTIDGYTSQRAAAILCRTPTMQDGTYGATEYTFVGARQSQREADKVTLLTTIEQREWKDGDIILLVDDHELDNTRSYRFEPSSDDGMGGRNRAYFAGGIAKVSPKQLMSSIRRSGKLVAYRIKEDEYAALRRQEVAARIAKKAQVAKRTPVSVAAFADKVAYLADIRASLEAGPVSSVSAGAAILAHHGWPASAAKHGAYWSSASNTGSKAAKAAGVSAKLERVASGAKVLMVTLLD